MPNLMNAVIDSDERLRLCLTVQAQVEEQLVLRLHHSRDIPIGRRSTHAITKHILCSADCGSACRISTDSIGWSQQLATIVLPILSILLSFAVYRQGAPVCCCAFPRPIVHAGECSLADSGSVWGISVVQTGVRGTLKLRTPLCSII